MTHRHGARLDAADKAWHLSSPAPYDPPLTYGGWTQSQALGARIASLLQTREQLYNESGSIQGHQEDVEVTDFASSSASPLENKSSLDDRLDKRKKHKIFIHSSPFQRCVQTSIAIGAGIAQVTRRHEMGAAAHSRTPRGGQNFHSKSSLGKSSDDRHSPTLAPIKQGEVEKYESNVHTQSEYRSPSNLRIDAFLGEWLSPEYYESITPPPESTLMVAGAKADLLRRGEIIEEFQAVGNQMLGNFPGGWGSGTNKTSASAPPSEIGPLANMSSMSQALSHRERSSSHSVTHLRPKSPLATYSPKTSSSYIPPQPAYAISPTEPIPRGYVAHAREACMDIDYQWDSMRPPQDWGDGGVFGEEWSAMHKRFRGGLSKMIQWYRDHGSKNPVEEDHKGVSSDREENEDEDADIVLVLVTHGAGCNALIGALTDQPVLLDVRMASLTMAVRKDTAAERPPFSPSDAEANKVAGSGKKGSIATELSQEYDMRLVASSEHLRAGVDPTKIQSISSSPGTSKLSLDRRRRQGTWSSQASPLDTFAIGEPIHAMSSALGSIRRTSVTAIPPPLNRAATLHHPPVAENPPAASGGLWSKRPSTAGEDIVKNKHSPGHDLVLNFADVGNKVKPQGLDGTDEQENDEASSTVPPMPSSLGRSLSQHGLWGSSPSGSRTEREKGPKRRWTLIENEH